MDPDGQLGLRAGCGRSFSPTSTHRLQKNRGRAGGGGQGHENTEVLSLAPR